MPSCVLPVEPHPSAVRPAQYKGDWEAYMDDAKIGAFAKIETAEFLTNYEFVRELERGTTGEIRKFRTRSREFMERLVASSWRLP